MECLNVFASGDDHFCADQITKSRPCKIASMSYILSTLDLFFEGTILILIYIISSLCLVDHFVDECTEFIANAAQVSYKSFENDTSVLCALLGAASQMQISVTFILVFIVLIQG